MRPRVTAAVVLSAALLALGGAATPSPAATAAAKPGWSIVSESQPTYFHAGDSSDAYVLIVRNDGGMATAKGSTVIVNDTLPTGVTAKGVTEGLTATKVTTSGEGANGSGSPQYKMRCPQVPVTTLVSCVYEEGVNEVGVEQGAILPGATIVVTITVSIPAEVTVLGPNSATVSGGGAASATTSETTPIDGEVVPFGLSFFNLDVDGEDGEADTQAGSHPFELTTSLAFNVSSRESPSAGNGEVESPLANAAPKDLEVQLPAGLIGNPAALPQCSQRAFLEGEKLNCPLDTQIGTVKPLFYGTFPSAVYPLYNVVPPPGQPAELGVTVAGIGHIPFFFHVRSNGDYGLTVQLDEIPETGPLQGAILTLWGVPAEASHDLEREGTLGEGAPLDGEFCKPSVHVTAGLEEQKRCPSGMAARPFLTLPSSCPGTELPVSVRSDSWQNPEQPSPLEPEAPGTFLPEQSLPASTGCEALSFDPTLAVEPETLQAGAPSGYTIELHVPQNEGAGELATADLRTAVVRLPVGAVISPALADGLEGCSEEQFAAHSLAAAACPSASQIGTVKIVTPLVSSPLEGQVFLGEPECDPCTPSDAQHGRLIRLLVQAQGSGVTVKLEGSTSIDQGTGQLTATFRNSPQLPFEDLTLKLDGGPNAALANPSTCGTPVAGVSWLTSYGSEQPVGAASEPFELGGCPSPQFDPSFTAGTTDNQAGGFSPLTVTLSRREQDEGLDGVSVQLAAGLLAMLSKVQPCALAQAQASACGAQSEIGTATVGAGPGSNPLFLGGQVYLTGPYEGAPFGLSIVVPAVAGPLNLGTIEIGGRIEVSPSTAALTIVTDPLPQSLDGVPLQLRTVNLDIDREGFVFNPTSCQPQAIEGTLDSSEGAVADVASRFQAAGCTTLAFKPTLTALTHARTSKVGGAYLHVRLVFAAGQANIAKLKVDMPRQLAARLSTLEKACGAAVIEANPASCPVGSVVGSATIVTPMFGRPLAGPAYLVSHGDLAAPDIELVLQGEGVTIEEIGQTSVKNGVTSSAFKALPDVPISTFDLVLDEGPDSLLAANLPAKARWSMCGQRLGMDTAITGQNGAVVKQTTNIAVVRVPDAEGAPQHEAQGVGYADELGLLDRA